MRLSSNHSVYEVKDGVQPLQYNLPLPQGTSSLVLRVRRAQHSKVSLLFVNRVGLKNSATKLHRRPNNGAHPRKRHSTAKE